MIRTLTVSGNTGLFNEKQFIASDNESVEIKLEVKNEVRIGVYRLIIRHGNAQILRKDIKNGQTVVLTPQWVKWGGNSPIEFDLIFLNKDMSKVLNDNYQIEPLAVDTVDGDFKFSAYVQSLEDALSALDARYKELEKRVQEYETNGIILIEDEEKQEEPVVETFEQENEEEIEE